jgi:hypothetical protein
MFFLARHATIFAVAFAALASTAPVCADTGPVFVVPSRPGVPVPINGRDASWSVVEGDIGLARPGHLTPVIIGGGRPLPPRWSFHHNPYFPRYGTMPGRGRHEVEPPPDRALPEPAENFSRVWSTTSDPYASEPNYREPPRPHPPALEHENLPPTVDNQPQFAPPIVVVPREGRRRP